MIHVFLKSSWNSVDPAPKDPILEVTEAFLADPSPDIVNVRVSLLGDSKGLDEPDTVIQACPLLIMKLFVWLDF
ncbi:hypothetical protein UlMin_023452 [Ulmus minor]